MKNLAEYSYSQIIGFLIILNILLKLPFLFIDTNPSDVYFYYSTGYLLLNDILPYYTFDLLNLGNYEIFVNTYHPNGPFNYLYYTFILICFGNSVLSIKFTWLIAEIVISCYIFKIALLMVNIKKSIMISILYIICVPSYYTGILVGCDELITGAFTIMAVYYIFNKRPLLGGFLLNLGFAYKMYPIFLLPPIVLYYWANERKTELLKFILSFSVTYIIIAFPYLILCPTDFFKYTFGQANRLITISYMYYHSQSWFYQKILTIPIINLNLTPHLIYSILIMGGFFIWDIYQFIQKKEYNFQTFMRSCVYYLSMLPVVSLSYNYRYFQWLLPFLIFYLFLTQQKPEYDPIIKKESSNIEIKKMIILFAVYSGINLFIILITLIPTGDHDFLNYLKVTKYFVYIVVFSVIYTLFFLTNERIFRKNSLIIIYNRISYLQGLAGLALYISLGSRLMQIPYELTFLYLSLIFLSISIVLILYLLFSKNSSGKHSST